MKRSGARIDGPYRYRLWREWGDELDRVIFIMLNPSKADGERDDPTVRRCIGFAKALGAGALDVVNLFALISTNPDNLLTAVDPVGPENDGSICSIVCTPTVYPPGEPVGRRVVICAWGAHPLAVKRGKHVLELLAERNVPALCLRRTKHGGHPAHPLRLPGYLRPIPLVRPCSG